MFSINLDISQIQDMSKDIQASLEAAAKQAGEELAQRTRAKAIELAMKDSIRDERNSSMP
jgi:predicted transcriptional regulator YheO